MKNMKFIAIAIIIPSILIFSSCSDNDLTSAPDELLFSEVQNEVNNSALEEDAFNIAEAAVKAFTESGTNSSPNVTKKSKGNDYPMQFEIDYGNNYQDKKGNVYKGTIKYEFTSKNESEFELDNFFINDNPIEGNKRIKLLEKGVTSIVSDVEFSNNKTNQTKFRKTEQQRIGSLVKDPKNLTEINSYSITGTIVGNIFKNGKEFEYNFNIEQPLVFITGTRSIFKGITIIRIGASTQYTNYGVGDKEKNATWLFK